MPTDFIHEKQSGASSPRENDSSAQNNDVSVNVIFELNPIEKVTPSDIDATSTTISECESNSPADLLTDGQCKTSYEVDQSVDFSFNEQCDNNSLCKDDQSVSAEHHDSKSEKQFTTDDQQNILNTTTINCESSSASYSETKLIAEPSTVETSTNASIVQPPTITAQLRSHVAPFRVAIVSNAMLMMDVHSHLAMTEVIGLLGGKYISTTRELHILLAIPCNSYSTGIQCEMDPVSEMHARDIIDRNLLEVVGWYHSHPTFPPNPSLRDIENQAHHQNLFAHEDATEPFVGIIITPYDVSHPSDVSQFNFVTISKFWNTQHQYQIPFQLQRNIIPSATIPEGLINQLSVLIAKYSNYTHKANLSQSYRRGESTTRLEKMLTSIRARTFVSDDEQAAFLHRLRELLEASMHSMRETETEKEQTESKC